MVAINEIPMPECSSEGCSGETGTCPDSRVHRRNAESRVPATRSHRRGVTLGRWLTRDPVGYRGGINLYGFVNSSPVGNLDTEGLAGNGLPQISPPSAAMDVTKAQAQAAVDALNIPTHHGPWVVKGVYPRYSEPWAVVNVSSPTVVNGVGTWKVRYARVVRVVVEESQPLAGGCLYNQRTVYLNEAVTEVATRMDNGNSGKVLAVVGAVETVGGGLLFLVPGLEPVGIIISVEGLGASIAGAVVPKYGPVQTAVGGTVLSGNSGNVGPKTVTTSPP